MKINAGIVQQAADYVSTIFKKKLPESYKYHDISHTLSVVTAVNEIASGMTLPDHGKHILQVAAWFHDLGYIKQAENHEAMAAEFAVKFLEEREADGDDIRQVKACIMATRFPQKPLSLLEQVICDADMLHLGKAGYMDKAALIREEWRLTKGEKYTDEGWYRLNIDFINGHRFFTAYCNAHYYEGKKINILNIESELKKQEINKDRNEEKNLAKPKQFTDDTERGVEKLFRSASGNHMQLSGMADNKAYILLSINSIIISIILSVLAKKLAEVPYLVIPTILLLSASVASIVFAVITTTPKIARGLFKKDQISNRQVDSILFINFHQMDKSTYEWGIKEIMHNKRSLQQSMTNDMYFLGKLLAVKYRNLNIGYRIFMFGMIASILAFGISFIMH